MAQSNQSLDEMTQPTDSTSFTEVSLGQPRINYEDDDMMEVEDEVGIENDVNVNVPISKKRKQMTSRSPYWEHFEKYFCQIEKLQMARCKYCGTGIKADSKMHGTRGLSYHFKSCKKKPHEVATTQKRLSMQPPHPGQKGALRLWEFDQEKIREALCRMLILDEMPLRTVEKPGFQFFMSVACPMFVIPSRRTITKDIFSMYMNKKLELKSLIKLHAQRVSITTDTWTSIQKVNYMCLTVHFIDDDWNLTKRILNFCPISGHKGEDVGRDVEKCLKDWGIERLFTITVDNASSNDTAIAKLKTKFNDEKNNPILRGKYMHVRCIAHIINLVVQNGLKEKDESKIISRIRSAIRYIRGSPARYKKFNEYAELESLETKRMLCLDVPTRWNSTYLMLDAALSLRKVFEAYEDCESAYRIDLDGGVGVPNYFDWERAKILLKFLEHFYILTLHISGSLHVTSNIVCKEIFAIDKLLNMWVNNKDDIELSDMAKKMKEKYEKYWGSTDKMNKLLYYAVILDPRRKWAFIDWSFDKLYPCVAIHPTPSRMDMKEQVMKGFKELFEEYQRIYAHVFQGGSSINSQSSSQPSTGSTCMQAFSLDFDDEFEYQRFAGRNTNQVKSEVDKYLNEDFEPVASEHFNILQWWKREAHRYPILSKMARDVLAIPVSTVASEAAFSTGGRVLDAFRSSLSPKIVQALICAQDWFRTDAEPISVEEDLCEIEKLEKDLIAMGADTSILDS